MTQRVMVASEASEYVRMGVDDLRKMAAEGKIPSFRVGREYRFIESLLDTWLIERASQEASPSTAEPVAKRIGRTYTHGASALDAALARTKKKLQDSSRSNSPPKRKQTLTPVIPLNMRLQTG